MKNQKPKISIRKINKILKQTDWKEYQQKVNEAVNKEIDALDNARFKSLKHAQDHWLK